MAAAPGPAEGLPLEDAGNIQRVSSRTRPDAKAQRYDRQLRLWAASGQSRLERASVLIGPASATSAQILKNMVLPGIGSFTICDSSLVSADDVGNNFFLEADSEGKSRGQEVARLLCELNPEVQGEAVASTLIEALESHAASLQRLPSLVLAVNAPESEELQLADRCWDMKVPFFAVHTNGFTGLLRVQVAEHTVVETHPETLDDLRLDTPFPALSQYVQSLDFTSMNDHEHGHIPAIAILVHSLQQFKAEHEGRLPANAAERDELKRMIAAGKRGQEEENFDEALGMVWKACRPSQVPKPILELCEASEAMTLDSASPTFWLLVRALQAFLATPNNIQGLLPLPGVLPDMKADTQSYVTLQQIYRKKAKDDVALLTQEINRILQAAKLPQHAVAQEEISLFAKHAAVLRLFRSRRLRDEYTAPKGLVCAVLAEPDPLNRSSPASHYVASRAAGRFRDEYGRWPGSSLSHADMSKDTEVLIQLAANILSTAEGAQVRQTVLDSCAESVRAGGAELPQIAALVGGIVAQEAVKIITSQYAPLDATCVFDGIRSTTSVLRF